MKSANVVALVLSLTIAGCSSDPSCDSSETKSALFKIAKDNPDNRLSKYASSKLYEKLYGDYEAATREHFKSERDILKKKWDELYNYCSSINLNGRFKFELGNIGCNIANGDLNIKQDPEEFKKLKDYVINYLEGKGPYQLGWQLNTPEYTKLHNNFVEISSLNEAYLNASSLFYKNLKSNYQSDFDKILSTTDYSAENIRTKSMDPNTKAVACLAKLKLNNKMAEYSLDIFYTVEKTKDGNYVEIQNFK